MNTFELRPQIPHIKRNTFSQNPYNYYKHRDVSVLDNIMDDDGNLFMFLDNLDYTDELNDSTKCTCHKCGPYNENMFNDDEFVDDIEEDDDMNNKNEESDVENSEEDPKTVDIINTRYEEITLIKPKTPTVKLPLTDKNVQFKSKQKLIGKWKQGTKEIRENPFTIKIVKKETVVKSFEPVKKTKNYTNDLPHDIYNSTDEEEYY